MNVSYEGSKWSVAAKAGIILSLVTILTETASSLIDNSFAGIVFWCIKLVGSLWLLRFAMNGWSISGKTESAFSFGFAMCLCSSIICAAYSFLLYKYIVPEKVTETFAQVEANLSSVGNIPDEAMDMVLRMEDNYAQISSVATLVWCVLLGLIFSAIFNVKPSGTSQIFTDEEMKENADEEMKENNK